jgi:hypothetical protein
VSRRLPAVALILALWASSSGAQAPWALVSPEQDARDRAAPHTAAPIDLPAPPVIELLRPDISNPIRNPVTNETRFSAGPGATINMSSFGATYGWLGINITNRLLEHATKTPNGLLAKNVDIPPGNHRVTISIADTTGKTASRTFRFSIVR